MSSKQDHWSAHLANWAASGQSASAWCRAHDVSVASFSYWRRKLDAQALSPALPDSLPIRMAQPAPSATVEVHLRGGTRISLSAPDPAWLASLLQRLDAC